MSSESDRNHEPTALRLQQARADGNIAKSVELATSLSMLGALGAAYVTFSQWGQWLSSWTSQVWGQAGQRTDQEAAAVVEQIQQVAWQLAGLLLPFLAIVWLTAIAASWLQTGPLWLPQKMAPDLTRVGPRTWLDQFRFSKLAWSLVSGLPKVLLAVVILFASLYHQRETLLQLAVRPAGWMVADLFQLIMNIALHVTSALLLVAGLDYLVNRADHRARLRMSDQEIRDEQRMQDGDPVSRSRQRQLNRVH